MTSEIGERFVQDVSLIYKRGQLEFTFRGKMSYDSSLKDEEYTGWQFDGEHFVVHLFNSNVMEVHQAEKEYLCWSYRLLKDESPEGFFMNLLNALGGQNVDWK